LMRSRYSAYVMGLGEYLLATQAPAAGTHSAEELSTWGRRVKWLGLRILHVDRGGPTDARGTVEFEATYQDGEQLVTQREVSRFDRVGGKWRYLEGRASRR
jgi:SEC-C motif-containing protein